MPKTTLPSNTGRGQPTIGERAKAVGKLASKAKKTISGEDLSKEEKIGRNVGIGVAATGTALSVGAGVLAGKATTGVIKLAEKVIALVKKLIAAVQSAINKLIDKSKSDEELINKYSSQLHSDPDKFSGIKISMLKLEGGDRDSLTALDISSDDPENYRRMTNTIENISVGTEETTVGAAGGVDALISGMKDASKAVASLNKSNLNKALARLQKNKQYKKETLSAYTEYSRKAVNTALSVATTEYKCYRAAVLKCIGTARNIKESTMDLMIEAANEEVDSIIKSAIDECAAFSPEELDAFIEAYTYDPNSSLIEAALDDFYDEILDA